MISLSRLIKSYWANQEKDGNKVISIKVLRRAELENEKQAFDSTDSERNSLIEQAHKDAEQIVSKANDHARMIKRLVEDEKLAWEQEKAALIEQAKHEGFQAGYKEGRQKGFQEYKESIELAREVIDSAKNDYRLTLESSDKAILELALKVSEKILGKIIDRNEEEFLHLVKRALKEAREYREIQLHVHPIHYGFLLAQKEELLSIFPRETNFYIYPDEDLSKTSCIIESANGRIDASIDSQLEQVKKKLFELLESEE
ncbi:flagellar assembly protein FliH [Bacillus methanolicus]|uniref:flagellar assembly protein FliH n=1 Tax=Bacillus methanolicus TaxID=1471 RepID=UPI0031594745